MTHEEILNAISEMSVLELSELVKAGSRRRRSERSKDRRS